jgi:hypothetical protein
LMDVQPMLGSLVCWSCTGFSSKLPALTAMLWHRALVQHRLTCPEEQGGIVTGYAYMITCGERMVAPG